MKKGKRWRLIIFALLLVIVCWSGLNVRHYEVRDENVITPVRLAVIADLHSTLYGENQLVLMHELEKAAPDVVLMVGDIGDSERPFDNAMLLIEQMAERWPGFYVTGNNEFDSGEVAEIKQNLRDCGIVVLEGEMQELGIGETDLLIGGLDDLQIGEEMWRNQLSACNDSVRDGAVNILLSHRPERIEDYAACGFDLILSGHAHGGQVRIPGILNGLFAPDQGIFPKYAGGQYEIGESTMIVSRGLMRNIVPRVFNPPELVIVDLLPEQ